jgi:hypothetical protein
VALDASAPTAKPLNIVPYEGNQIPVVWREVLTTDIPYEHNRLAESPRRKNLKKVSVRRRQPYLMDPNTGAT